MKVQAVLLAAVLSGVVAPASALGVVSGNLVGTMFGRLIPVDALYGDDGMFAEASGLEGTFAPSGDRHTDDGRVLTGVTGVTSSFGSPPAFDGEMLTVDLAADVRRNPLGPVTAQVTAVPEPETYVLMLAGLGAVGFLARRRRAQR